MTALSSAMLLPDRSGIIASYPAAGRPAAAFRPSGFQARPGTAARTATRPWQRYCSRCWARISRKTADTPPIIDVVPGSPEWEAICRRCGECCFELVYDEDDTLMASTMCEFLDPDTRLCTVYETPLSRSATTASSSPTRTSRGSTGCRRRAATWCGSGSRGGQKRASRPRAGGRSPGRRCPALGHIPSSSAAVF